MRRRAGPAPAPEIGIAPGAESWAYFGDATRDRDLDDASCASAYDAHPRDPPSFASAEVSLSASSVFTLSARRRRRSSLSAYPSSERRDEGAPPPLFFFPFSLSRDARARPRASRVGQRP